MDRINLHYYSADPNNIYSRTSSGTNHTGYYQTRFLDFCQSTTTNSTNVFPIFSSENISWGAGSNFFGYWISQNVNNNIFTAEKIWYNDWFADANLHSPTVVGSPTKGNVITPGGIVWFTSSYMVNHLDRPIMYKSNSPVCVSPGQNGTFQFQYQGPIEQGVSYKFYLTDAGDTTLRCGSMNPISWPPYDANSQTSIDLNAALNGCSLPIGNYDVHLELTYSTGCSTCIAPCSVYVAPVTRVRVVTAGEITALTSTTACQGNAVYLQAGTTENGTSSYQWYKGNQSINGATASTYAPTQTGTSDYSCRITSSNVSCSANRTQPISVTINPNPAASITVQSSSACGRILKANPTGASYLWPNGSTGSTYSANRAGTYSVEVTANGCKSTTLYTYGNVNLSLKEFIAECSGINNGSLKVNVSAGVTPYSISWNGPVNGNDTGLIAGNYLIAGLSTGTYSVIVTDANGCTASLQLLVPSAPQVTPSISSNSPVCNGGTLNLSASGGIYYSWNGPGNFSSGVQNPVIPNASLAGDYTVTVTNQSGCTASITTSVDIESYQGGVVSNNSPLCSGSDLTFIASGGVSYNWLGPDSFMSQQQNPVIPSAGTQNAGNYVVVITDSNGCSGFMTTVATIYDLPAVSASNSGPGCPGADVQLFSGGGQSYSWSGPNGFISFDEDPLIMNLNLSDTGLYSIIITDSNSCIDSSTTYLSILTQQNYYADADGDSYGAGSPQQLCSSSGIFTSLTDGDCDDNDSTVYPLASEVCSNGIDENCNGMNDDICTHILQVKVFIEGFYRGNGEMVSVMGDFVTCDTIVVELHASQYPYQLLFSHKDTIDIYGNGTFEFPLNVSGNEYYVVIKHRNALETWSNIPLDFTGNLASFNITLNPATAFGNNLKDLGDGYFAIYSGDINNDGSINIIDLDVMAAEILTFTSGYTLCDLTGDQYHESTDCSLLENNIGINALKP